MISTASGALTKVIAQADAPFRVHPEDIDTAEDGNDRAKWFRLARRESDGIARPNRVMRYKRLSARRSTAARARIQFARQAAMAKLRH